MPDRPCADGLGQSLSAANRLAPAENRAQVISGYFMFAYCGLAIPVVGVGVAIDYFGDLRAVLGTSIVLALLCVLSAVGIADSRARRAGARGQVLTAPHASG